MPLQEKIQRQQENNRLELLPITSEHIYGLAHLPDYHRDSFDRLLLSQAVIENIPLISHDPQIAKYPVKIIW